VRFNSDRSASFTYTYKTIVKGSREAGVGWDCFAFGSGMCGGGLRLREPELARLRHRGPALPSSDRGPAPAGRSLRGQATPRMGAHSHIPRLDQDHDGRRSRCRGLARAGAGDAVPDRWSVGVAQEAVKDSLPHAQTLLASPCDRTVPAWEVIAIRPWCTSVDLPAQGALCVSFRRRFAQPHVGLTGTALE
jgi:hypothetical protein